MQLKLLSIKNLVSLVAALHCVAVVAQTPEFSFAKFGGQMHGEATICGGYTPSELNELKRQQKEQFVGLGMKTSQFESEFQQGYKEGREGLEMAQPAARAKRCEQLRKMAKMK